jgi:menaquinone-dependent protoporphyrinogen oxidase
MTKVLIVVGSRHGGTRGIADRIAEILETEGLEAVVSTPDRVAAEDLRTADAFLVGSGVYMGSWLNEPLDFLTRHADELATRPTWLFSSGPLPGSSREQVETDPLTNALGPTDGPGSGGRKKIEAASERIQARDHRVFLGAFDPKDPPRALSERLVRMMPAARNVLPPGDFRDWDAIEAWAREIAAGLAAQRLVGVP